MVRHIPTTLLLVDSVFDGPVYNDSVDHAHNESCSAYERAGPRVE